MLVKQKYILLDVSTIAQDKISSTLEFSIILSAGVAMTNLPIHPRLLRLSAIGSVLGTPPKCVAEHGE